MMRPLPKLIAWTILGTCACGQISEVFRDPEKACALLEPEGFSSGELTFHPHGFQCSASVDRKELRYLATNNPARAVITYTVSGESIYRVSRIKLIVHFQPYDNPKQVLEHFTKLSEIVLTRLGIDVPKELPDVIRSTRYRRWLQKTGHVSLDPGRAPHTSRVLAIRHPGIRVMPIPRAGTAGSPQ